MIKLDKYLYKHDIVNRWMKGEEKFAHLNLLQEAMLIVGSFYSGLEHQVIIKSTDQEVLNLIDKIHELDPNIRTYAYIHESSLRIEALTQSQSLKKDRLNSLDKLIHKEYDVFVTHASATTRILANPKRYKEAHIILKKGMRISQKDLIYILESLSYQRVKYVEQAMTYAVRGFVFDIYSANYNNPLRIEFFDDEIESIRIFDSTTQKSRKEIDKARIIFASDILLKEDEKKSLAVELRHHIKDQDILNEQALYIEQLSMGIYQDEHYNFLSLYNEKFNIFDFIHHDKIYINAYESVISEYKEYLVDSELFLQEQEDVKLAMFLGLPFCLSEHKIEDSIKIYQYNLPNNTQSIHIPWHPIRYNFSSPQEELDFITSKSNAYIYIDPNDKNVYSNMIKRLNKKIKSQLVYEELGTSIELGDLSKEIYSFKEILYKKEKKYRYDKKFQQSESLERLQDLDTYDYVVHRQYGIGKYLGIITREYEGIQKDYMNIMYQGGDELFVPLEQFHLVRKYLPSDAKAVKLNKLGSKTWERNKAKVKKDVAKIADKMIKLYAERSKVKGFSFSKDGELHKQFSETFPHELTEDQKKALDEINKDMESSIPMDRLLSGDVGFGKTELALRASFKAVYDSKQVAYLCPTTILSQQHYNTYISRFKNFPIRIEVLNRFISQKKQKKILEDLKEGKVDVLIGTHRILSKDVNFKDLGLVIIDEEQRFGVEHKERMKEIRSNVDVLSLSATPIPRTLQMSLIGLRSLSQLNTPPKNRLPVMTYVIEKDKKTLLDVIKKELRRKGQVFYLYNNVQQIYTIANDIQRNLPNAHVDVIHGQMDRTLIEDKMIEFVNKKTDVLVCTTIIETGIDIPNANTMIVDNAHRFGLSQLYQIKGRVGRSDRLAYAYFVVPKKKALNEIAQKRLQAIKEFSDLGSGYKIAMRDLSIRGAGELLGAEQSGFIDTVGMDLYVELLKEAIEEKKGKKSLQKKENNLYVQASGYLPEGFTFDDSEKLDIYENILQIQNLDDLYNFESDLNDRYGSLPLEVEQLLGKTELELLLNDTKIFQFIEKPKKIILIYTQEYSDNLDGVKLFELLSDISYDIEIKYLEQKIQLHIPKVKDWQITLIEVMKGIGENCEVR